MEKQMKKQTSTPLNEAICPLCGADNGCQAEQAKAGGRCWCFADNLTPPAALLQRLPEHLRHKACICNACITAFLSSSTTTD